jgi:hypothetical protein
MPVVIHDDARTEDEDVRSELAAVVWIVVAAAAFVAGTGCLVWAWLTR